MQLVGMVDLHYCGGMRRMLKLFHTLSTISLLGLRIGANSLWFLTGFYGEPKMKLKKNSWHLLYEICPPDYLPWMVLRDFNEIFFHYEKFGGKPICERLIQNFLQALKQCYLHELGHTGDLFT